MYDFDRCNKVTGVYWLKSPVENVKIKICLKPHEGIQSLPKFETYKNDTNNHVQQLESNKTEEQEFKWQEKAFSLHEIQRYSDIHNCISENDLSYHDMLEQEDYQPSKIFTYTHYDYHLPIPFNKIKKTTDILNLKSCFEKMNLNDRIFKEDTTSMAHLFKSEESIAVEEKWKSMHIMYDNSEYNEDSHLLLKQEVTLLSLYHNMSQNYLIVSPDVNNLELNPYQLDHGYEYAVDVTFDQGGGEELLVLLKKLSKKWEKRHKQLIKFVMPPLGRRHYFVTLELLKATDFELDNLYVEFHIKLPEELKCSDALHGRTHVSKSSSNEDKKQWSFGHLVELSLEAALNADIPPIKIFFEVISTDWWGRQRTEGYCYLPLALQPGRYSKQLSCSRPEELDHVAAESRRFFVGGCHLIKDLEILAKPQLQDANFKFTTTGTLSVRWSTIAQAPQPGFKSSAPSQVSHASALLRGAEAALRQYKRARARLAAATKDLENKSEEARLILSTRSFIHTEFKSSEPSQVSHASALLRGAEAALRQNKRARARLAAATKDLENKVEGTRFGSDDD